MNKLKKYLAMGVSSILMLYTASCGLKSTKWKLRETYEERIPLNPVSKEVVYHALEPVLKNDTLEVRVFETKYDIKVNRVRIEEKQVLEEVKTVKKYDDIGFCLFASFIPFGVFIGAVAAYTTASLSQCPSLEEKGDYWGCPEAQLAGVAASIGATALLAYKFCGDDYKIIETPTGKTKTETGKSWIENEEKEKILIYKKPLSGAKIEAFLNCASLEGEINFSEHQVAFTNPEGIAIFKFENLANVGRNELELKNTPTYKKIKQEYSEVVAENILQHTIPLQCKIRLEMENLSKDFRFYGYSFEPKIIKELLK